MTTGEPPVLGANATLELNGVTKFYGDFKAVDDLSFQLEPGLICGFLGPNGAGKTTTLRMILEIIKPSQGTITILGHSSALAVRHRLGYLPEEKGLYKKMKAWAVIAYFASLKGMQRQAARRRAYELLERYGLKAFADKPTDALSKGMGQKVQMLASIAHDPEFVILDEPFSGLDPVNQQVMEEVIRDMAKRKRTVLFSTHVMQHAERLCDRILLIAKGRKIFDGTIPAARGLLPRRVRLETGDDIAPLRDLQEVASLTRVERTPVDASANGMACLGPQLMTGDAARSAPVLGRIDLEMSSGPENAGAFTRSVVAAPEDGRTPPSKTDPLPACWELELREHAETEAVLQTCFAKGIRLRSFNQSEPTLHEVFVRLVGEEAREAGLR